MSSIGQLGIPGSQLGYITLGVSYPPGGIGAFDFGAHVITANKIRVYYNRPVTDTALDPSAYILTSLAPPGTAIVPSIDEVVYFNDSRVAVILNLNLALTSGTDYSLEINNVVADDGEVISSGARNFTANVIDYPIAIGAWQSKRDAVDILFDRSVGPESIAATFEIRDASLPGPGVAASQLTWTGENIPETTLRIQLPPGMPVANAYEIDYSGVKDASLNELAGTVPLTLALRSIPPYSYAELRQLQITDAYVVDVSNDFLSVGTVRVYFNGPVLDSATDVNWAVYQKGVHLKIDPESEITTPYPPDIPSLIILVNEWKADFNAHLIRRDVHLVNDTTNTINTPDAFDSTSAYALINEEQLKYTAHLQQNKIHLYQDNLHNNHVFLNVIGNFGLARAVLWDLRGEFNDHVLLDEYLVSFSDIYLTTPVGKITEFCRYDVTDMVFNTCGPYTLYTDLHLTMDSNIPSIRLEASLTSEDGGSVTNPADYTGGITARPGNSIAQRLSIYIVPEEEIIINYDRHITLLGSNSLEIFDSDDETIPSHPRVITSMPACIWALNNAIMAYNWHLNIPSFTHQIQDTVNTISFTDYAVLPISTVITKANDFKIKLTTHMSSNIFHYHADDSVVMASDAIDEKSLAILIENIQQVCIEHFGKIGPHSIKTYRIVSAPVQDMIIMDADFMINGEKYNIIGTIQNVYHDNLLGTIYQDIYYVPIPLGSDFYYTSEVNLEFTGLATRPSLASAIPKLGLIIAGGSLKFESDTVEVFFSKPMDRTPINSSNLPIVGGNISSGKVNWVDSYRASIQVQSMGNIAYTITANDVWDVAGNLIF